MVNLVFDIETDDLDATKIWCIFAYDIDEERMYGYGPELIDEGIELLRSADRLIGHNIIGFDIPVIKNLTGVDLSDKKVSDTLVLSRLFNPTREGNHGLASWGYRLGHNKIEFDNFSEFSDEMFEYCENDVMLTAEVYKHLKTESKGFSNKSVELEHSMAWALAEQRAHGFLLDEYKSTMLIAELQEKLYALEKEVHKEFKPRRQEYTLRSIYTSSGSLSKLAKSRELNKKFRLTSEEYEEIKDTKKIKRVIETEFNLGSRKQIGEYLQDFGWQPRKFTPTGQPIVDEGTLNKIKDIPQAQLIAEYLTTQKRLAQVSSWLQEMEEDNRVRGFVNPNGTVTGRMTQSNPNMAQVPSTKSVYGKECRSCWIAPTGYKLIGIDASGLELRMLAHYMGDKEFTHEILNGDIHTANKNIAGLESRDQAKTFIYALIYGPGDGKLGSVVGGNKKDGKRLREHFFANLPAFADLRSKVSGAAGRGFLKGIDGRKIYVRSVHSALNTLLQSAGAIVMKEALDIFLKYIRSESLAQLRSERGGEVININAHVVANVHDEWQVEVKEEKNSLDLVGYYGVHSIIKAGKNLKLNCPLDGEYKIGDNWSETH